MDLKSIIRGRGWLVFLLSGVSGGSRLGGASVACGVAGLVDLFSACVAAALFLLFVAFLLSGRRALKLAKNHSKALMREFPVCLLGKNCY